VTIAAADRRAARAELFPHVLEALKTRSMMRYVSTPGKIRAAAKQLAFRLVANVPR
jgi:hypothetical protein